jgi:hypothetical protein
MTGHTPVLKVARLDVISSGARRRWTLDEKRTDRGGELRRAAAGVGDIDRVEGVLSSPSRKFTQ